jgi:hypothetical protein
MAHAERALGGFAHRGEGGHQQVVELAALRQLLAELGGARPELFVAQLFQFGFERVDGIDLALVALDGAIIGRAENTLGERSNYHMSGPLIAHRRAGEGRFEMQSRQRVVVAMRKPFRFEFLYPRRAAEKRLRCKSEALSCQRRQNGRHLLRPAGNPRRNGVFGPLVAHETRRGTFWPRCRVRQAGIPQRHVAADYQ